MGLDREAAAQLFSEFVGGSKATPEQIEFIDLIINELTQNGVMEPERLFQSPYTDLNAQGPMGLFPQADVMQIVGVLKLVKERAAA